VDISISLMETFLLGLKEDQLNHQHDPVFIHHMNEIFHELNT
jgi:hypothetical protein